MVTVDEEESKGLVTANNSVCGETAACVPGGTQLVDLHQIDKCLAGEREAFGELVRKYQEVVYRFSYRICGSREQAEDITQESFVRAYQRLSSLRRKAAFKSWLFRIALNLCRDSFAGRNAVARYETPLESVADGLATADPGFDPEKSYLMRVARKVVWEALDRLSTDERALFIMKYVEGMSYTELKEVSGALTIGLLKVRLYRTREKLSGYLGKNWGGGDE